MFFGESAREITLPPGGPTCCQESSCAWTGSIRAPYSSATVIRAVFGNIFMDVRACARGLSRLRSEIKSAPARAPVPRGPEMEQAPKECYSLGACPVACIRRFAKRITHDHV